MTTVMAPARRHQARRSTSASMPADVAYDVGAFGVPGRRRLRRVGQNLVSAGPHRLAERVPQRVRPRVRGGLAERRAYRGARGRLPRGGAVRRRLPGPGRWRRYPATSSGARHVLGEGSAGAARVRRGRRGVRRLLLPAARGRECRSGGFRSGARWREAQARAVRRRTCRGRRRRPQAGPRGPLRPSSACRRWPGRHCRWRDGRSGRADRA